MMGRLNRDQGQLLYCFNLDEVVPEDHLVRAIAAVLDLSWVYAELAPYYSRFGRPSLDPVLMIRMLIVGYVFAIRSERALCRDVRVNLAYRWFCGLSLEDKIPDHSAFTRAHIAFRLCTLYVVGAAIWFSLYRKKSWIPRGPHVLSKPHRRYHHGEYGSQRARQVARHNLALTKHAEKWEWKEAKVGSA
jgi:hypothetical protein